MFCNYCGTENADGATFCSKCGQPFVKGKTKQEIMQEKLDQLSVANIKPVNQNPSLVPPPRKSTPEKAVVYASPSTDPIEDPYWDDVLPEINKELAAIPKDNIAKVAGAFVALFAIIIYLIYTI